MVDGLFVRCHDDCSTRTMSRRVKAMVMMTYVHVDADSDYFGCLYYAFDYDDDDVDYCLSSIVDDR